MSETTTPQANPTYEWKGIWIHKTWQPMPGVTNDDQMHKFLKDRLPHSEESMVRVNGGPHKKWRPPQPKGQPIHGMTCDCCLKWF